MSIKEFGGKLFAKFIVNKTKKWAQAPAQTQQKVFQQLIQTAQNTRFGKDHHFASIASHKDFVQNVPVRDYEGHRTYVEAIKAGQTDVLWPGKPLYFAKTSGTTSGTKYIPLTKESMPYHISAARNALLHYINETGNAAFLNGKMIFLQGSPEMHTENGIGVGRLSGIVAHYVPAYLQTNRLPSWETNCIENWEAKVDAIVDETIHEDMRLISGIPPWVQMYLERILEKSGAPNIKAVFPNLSLFVTGGVAYEPYRAKFERLFGGKVDQIELFPASEGFFAYQDQQSSDGLLLLLDAGIFYEFVPADQFFDAAPPRLTIGEVQLGVNYVMVVSTNAGLWAYNVGDTIAFVDLSPPRVKVTGRIKHFISAFGEHVIGSEVEQALQAAAEVEKMEVVEFTVAPQVNPTDSKLPYHEWFVATATPPANLSAFAATLDLELQKRNVYYKDLIAGSILRPAVVRLVAPDAFQQYMKSIGKLGGQNKVPRLMNDRTVAAGLEHYTTASSI
jgi:hypothetical protein